MNVNNSKGRMTKSKALMLLTKRIQLAQSKGAINAAEAMTLTHHYTMGSRAAKRYTSQKEKCLLSEIAGKVRRCLQADVVAFGNM